MKKSQILILLCLSFIGGVFINSIIENSQSLLWLVFLFVSSFFIGLGSINKKLILIGFIFLFFTFGLLRFEFFNPIDKTDDLIGYHNQDVVLRGFIKSEVQRRQDNQKILFQVDQIKKDNWRKVDGKVLVSLDLYPEYAYGDRLELKGELKCPKVFDDFDYKKYLANKGIYSVIYYPEVKLLEKNQGNDFYRIVFNIKEKSRAIIEKNLLPPHSAVIKAVVLGDRFSISDNFKQKLNFSGTRHIVAISGLHIILVMEILLYLALSLGLWRKQAFYFVLMVIFLYVLFIGFPASAIRAALMGSVLLLAQKLGRLRSADRALLFVATLMLIINPSLLLFDVGFQLSFSATLGIIYLKPIIDKKTEKLINPFGLKNVLTMTLSAQAGVLGLLVFHFGRISLISPLSNIFIVPILPLIIISGIFLLLLGFIHLSLAKIFIFIPWLFLDYVVKLVDFFASFSFSSVSFSVFVWPFFLFYYFCFFAFIVYKYYQHRNLMLEEG